MQDDPWPSAEWEDIQHGRFAPNALIKTEIPVSHDCPDISGLLFKRENCKNLIVLFSSGRPAKTHHRESHFELWKQAEKFANYNLLFLSDPVLKTPAAAALTFGVHHAFDCAAALGEAIEKVARMLNIDNSHILLYGYSQGGFLALQVGSILPKLRVIARCPIVDVEYSSSPREVEHIRKHAVGEGWTTFRMKHDERVNVHSRYLHERRIPEIIISTNRTDYTCEQSLDLATALISSGDDVDQIGRIIIQIDPKPQGHFPLNADEILAVASYWSNSPSSYSIGRESALAQSTPGSTAHPNPQELLALNTVTSINPLILSKKLIWLDLEQVSNPTSFHFSFKGSSTSCKSGVLIAFAIGGIRLSDMHKIPLTFSDIPSIGWYKYFETETGNFSRNISLELPTHCSISAVGLRIWNYEGDPLLVDSVEIL